MPSLIVNPDAHPETTTVDGGAEHDYGGSPQSWSTLRGAVGSGAVDDGTTLNAPYVQAGGSSDTWRRMTRAFFLFDTSSIPVGATITAATLELWPNSKQGASVSYAVIATAPASNTAIVAGDYDGITLTAISDSIASGSITTGAYNTWTLSDLTKITKAGITKLGLTFVEDINNSSPTWSNAQETSIVVQTAEGSNKPKLTVTYTVPGFGSPIFFT